MLKKRRTLRALNSQKRALSTQTYGWVRGTTYIQYALYSRRPGVLEGKSIILSVSFAQQSFSWTPGPKFEGKMVGHLLFWKVKDTDVDFCIYVRSKMRNFPLHFLCISCGDPHFFLSGRSGYEKHVHKVKMPPLFLDKVGCSEPPSKDIFFGQ